MQVNLLSSFSNRVPKISERATFSTELETGETVFYRPEACCCKTNSIKSLKDMLPRANGMHVIYLAWSYC